jgi:hypothetical protein
VLICGALFVVTAYATQLAHPGASFENPDSAAFEIARVIGGTLFASFFLAGLVVAQFAAGLAIQATSSRLPHVYVNQVGPAGTLNFVGGSTVVSADGEVDAQAGSSEEEVPGVSLLLPARSSARQDYLSELRSPMPGVKNVTSASKPGTRT